MGVRRPSVNQDPKIQWLMRVSFHPSLFCTEDDALRFATFSLDFFAQKGEATQQETPQKQTRLRDQGSFQNLLFDFHSR